MVHSLEVYMVSFTASSQILKHQGCWSCNITVHSSLPQVATLSSGLCP